MKEILRDDFIEVSEQLSTTGDPEQRAELTLVRDNLLKEIGHDPRIPYEYLGTTGEEIFEAVDLSPEYVKREPRVIFTAGQMERGDHERNSA